MAEPCMKCGHEFEQDDLGVYGCPNCHGDGLDYVTGGVRFPLMPTGYVTWVLVPRGTRAKVGD